MQIDWKTQLLLDKITDTLRTEAIQTSINIINKEKQESCKGRSVDRCPEPKKTNLLSYKIWEDQERTRRQRDRLIIFATLKL